MNAEVIYVTENGVGDGMSWNSATPLADALSWAAKGDEIYVAKGTYTIRHGYAHSDVPVVLR